MITDRLCDSSDEESRIVTPSTAAIASRIARDDLRTAAFGKIGNAFDEFHSGISIWSSMARLHRLQQPGVNVRVACDD